MKNFWISMVVAVVLMVGTTIAYMLTYDTGLASSQIGPWFAGTKVANDGWHKFERAGCANCHSILGQQGQPTGPDLTYVGQRWNSENVVKLLKNPRAFFPNTIMPKFDNLSDADLKTIGDYLETLK